MKEITDGYRVPLLMRWYLTSRIKIPDRLCYRETDQGGAEVGGYFVATPVCSLQGRCVFRAEILGRHPTNRDRTIATSEHSQ